jgi:hypothetical protein
VREKDGRVGMDHDLYPGCAWTPQRMVELSLYKTECHVQAARHTVETGERISATSVRLRICAELELTQEELARLVFAGDSILWDRELSAMSAEARAVAIAEFEALEPVDMLDVPEWRAAVLQGEQDRAEISMLEELMQQDDGGA